MYNCNTLYIITVVVSIIIFFEYSRRVAGRLTIKNKSVDENKERGKVRMPL